MTKRIKVLCSQKEIRWLQLCDILKKCFVQKLFSIKIPAEWKSVLSLYKMDPEWMEHCLWKSDKDGKNHESVLDFPFVLDSKNLPQGLYSD